MRGDSIYFSRRRARRRGMVREKYILSPISEAGFTLVEMLISLVIFGMITAAGVTLLTLTVRTQETSDRLLDNLGTLRRTGALLNADLAQAAPRSRSGIRRFTGRSRRGRAAGPDPAPRCR